VEYLMRFNRLSIRARIYAGFGALVLLGAALAGFGVYRLSDIGVEVGKMDALAGNVQRVLLATRNLEAVRRAETRYLFDATDDALKDARANAEKANALMIEAGNATLSEERRRRYGEVRDTLTAHAQKLDQFVQLTRTSLDERAKLFSGGDALTAATDRLTAAAHAKGDDAIVSAAAAVERGVLLVRVANWRFLATSDKSGPAVFKTNVEKARIALATMEQAASPDLVALIAPVRTALAAYEASFTAYSAARVGANDLYAEQMRPQILAMQEKLDSADASLSQGLEVARGNAFAVIANATLLEQVLGGIALVFGSFLAFAIGRGIVRPLTGMTSVMKQLAGGDHTIDVPARDNTDEIGDMARAVEVFKQSAIEAERVAAEQASERANKERRQVAMEGHTQDFGTSVSGVMASLAASADAMRSAAAQMSEAVTGVHGEASQTAGAASRSSEDLVSVAAAVQELNASVDEISRQVAAAAGVAHQAVQRAEASQESIRGLSDSTARIGDVVHLISDIAGQTNLLALNATIEAARAGEAGRGFAVVAGEVKALAAQTAKATADIGSQIETVRGATEQTIGAMVEISAIIGKMNEVTAAISAAVEQQSATTRELAASIQAVSLVTADTAQAMGHVVAVVDAADVASHDVTKSAKDIGTEAATLRSEVDRFLIAVRDDNQEQRRYERVQGNGSTATLRMPGRQAIRATLRDISRGGARLVCDWTLPSGTALEVDLPQGGEAVIARVVRCGAGELAVVFSADAAAFKRIDRTMDALSSARRTA
jgi:methyl-accepting chemotaxis protein